MGRKSAALRIVLSDLIGMHSIIKAIYGVIAFVGCFQCSKRNGKIEIFITYVQDSSYYKMIPPKSNHCNLQPKLIMLETPDFAQVAPITIY